MPQSWPAACGSARAACAAGSPPTALRTCRQEQALQTHSVELWAPQGRFQQLLVVADSREEQVVLARDRATSDRVRCDALPPARPLAQ